MKLWVRLKDIPSVYILVPKQMASKPQLVGFCIYLIMVFIDRYTLFCVKMETFKNLANAKISTRHMVCPH